MMRSASFFILSVSLHAAAMLYPVSFSSRSQAQLIQVTILPIGHEGSLSGGQGTDIYHPKQVRSPSVPRPTPNVHPSIQRKPIDVSHRQTLPAEAVTRVNDANVALASSLASATSSSPVSDATTQSDPGSATAMSGASSGGNGVGASGSGSELGIGNGGGASWEEEDMALTQARYRDTPRPDYPESARREGREGSVLLRVLVDDQGRSKRVDINSSSGSHALDRAAAEAIKQWRFHPARLGDKPVESWLRVPIEFRLADAKSR